MALEIVARHLDAQPASIIERAWVFAHDVPLWEWQRSRSELLLSTRVNSRRVLRAALSLGRTPVRRAPAG